MAKEEGKRQSVHFDAKTHQIALEMAGYLDVSVSQFICLSVLIAAPNLLSNPFMARIKPDDVKVTDILKTLECE